MPAIACRAFRVQSAKLRVDWDVAAGFAIGVIARRRVEPVCERRREQRRSRAGASRATCVANLDAQYEIRPRVTLFAQVDNLFDRQYANFGLLGSNVFTGPQRSFGPAAGIAPVAEQFRALGAPRGIWVGVRVAFGKSPARS